MALMCQTSTYMSYCKATPQLALCLLQNRFSKSILVSPIRSSDPTKSWSNIATVSSDSMGKETVSSTTLDRRRLGKCSQQGDMKYMLCFTHPTHLRTIFANPKTLIEFGSAKFSVWSFQCAYSNTGVIYPGVYAVGQSSLLEVRTNISKALLLLGLLLCLINQVL